MIELTRKKYSTSGELSKCSDSQLRSFYSRYQERLSAGEIHRDYRETLQHNLTTIVKILKFREEKKKSSTPEVEINNLVKKINAELDLIESFDKKIKKIESQKQDLEIKIKHQKERLDYLKSILER